MSDRAFRTASGLPRAQVYGAPPAGEFPFTRGVQPTRYRGRLWTMRQYAGFGTAAERNARYRYLLERGRPACPSPSTCPRRWATTADHPLAEGEVGKVGVPSIARRGHGECCSRASRSTGQHLDDDQRHGAILLAL